MLTKTDLKAIESLFDHKFDEKFEEKFKTAIKPLRKDLKAMEGRLTIRINKVADYFDEKILNHEDRIRNLEEKQFITT